MSTGFAKKPTLKEQEQLNISQSKILFNANGLRLDDCNGETLVVKPQPMATYERFYQLWCELYSLLDVSTTFMFNWVHDKDFRGICIEALNIFGIDALKLKPKQLEELLLIAEDQDKKQYPPLLFFIHEDSPDVGKIPKRETRPPDQSSPDSNTQDTSRLKFLGITL